jgi:hypothetical protein
MDAQHDLPARLTAGPLTLSVEQTPAGPMLATGDATVEPLTFAVNAAFGGVLQGLADRVASGESMARSGLYALHLSQVSGPPPGADNWRKLAGTDPGPDAYVVGAEFLREALVVPRDVLAEILAQLARLRDE